MNSLVVLAVFLSSLVALSALAWRLFPAPRFIPAMRRRAGYGAIALLLLLFVESHNRWDAIALSVLAACLCVCAATDRESGYIPDTVTFPVLAALLCSAVAGGRWEGAVQGAVACAAVIAILYGLSKGRGIGLGDLKLAACIGAGLGATLGLAALACAFVSGAMHAGSLLALHRIGRKDAITFAPYLAVGCVSAVFWHRIPWL